MTRIYSKTEQNRDSKTEQNRERNFSLASYLRQLGFDMMTIYRKGGDAYVAYSDILVNILVNILVDNSANTCILPYKGRFLSRGDENFHVKQ